MRKYSRLIKGYFILPRINDALILGKNGCCARVARASSPQSMMCAFRLGCLSVICIHRKNSLCTIRAQQYVVHARLVSWSEK